MNLNEIATDVRDTLHYENDETEADMKVLPKSSNRTSHEAMKRDEKRETVESGSRVDKKSFRNDY